MPRRDAQEMVSVVITGVVDPSVIHPTLKKGVLQVRISVLHSWLERLKKINLLYREIVIDMTSSEATHYLEGLSDQIIAKMHTCSPEAMAMQRIVGVDVANQRGEEGEKEGFDAYLIDNLGMAVQNASELFLESLNNRFQNVSATREPMANLQIQFERRAINEFQENQHLFLGAFPFLFLLGEGMPEKTSSAFFRHLLQQDSGHFGRNIQFLFLVYSQTTRHEVCRTSRSRIRARPEIIRKFQEVVSDSNFPAALEESRRNPQSDVAKKILSVTLPLIRTATAKIPYSPGESGTLIAELSGLWHFFGTPIWWVTLAPADFNHSSFFKIGKGIHENEDALLSLDCGQRLCFASKNPVACAEFFSRLTHCVFSLLVGLPPEHHTRKSHPRIKARSQGIFGRPFGWYHVIEAQGRGSLHFHSLVFANFSANKLTDLAESFEFRSQLFQFIELTMTTFLIPQVIPPSAPEPDESKWLLCKEGIDDRQSFLSCTEKVARARQLHRHTATCRKGVIGKKQCRMGMPRGMMESTTLHQLKWRRLQNGHRVAVPITPEDRPSFTLSSESPFPPLDDRVLFLETKRPQPQDQHVVAFSPTVSCAIRSNNNVELLGCQTQAVPRLNYIVKYITKNKCQLEQVLPLLQEAKSRVFTSVADDAGNPERNALFILQRTINSMNTLNEISAPMAAQSLLFSRSHESSHAFWWLFPAPALHYVEERIAERNGQETTMTTRSNEENDVKQKDDDVIQEDIQICHPFDGPEEWTIITEGHKNRECPFSPKISMPHSSIILDMLLQNDISSSQENPSSQGTQEVLSCDASSQAYQDDILNVVADFNIERDGVMKVAIPQHIHYAYRGEALSFLCLYTYAALISVVKKLPHKKKVNQEETLDGGEATISEIDDDTVAEEEDTTDMSHAGRKKNGTFCFAEGHPQAKTHHQVLRSKWKIPILSGKFRPRFPTNPSTPASFEQRESFAKFASVLFIPWHIKTCIPPVFGWDALSEWILLATDGRTEMAYLDKHRAMWIQNLAFGKKYKKGDLKLCMDYQNHCTTIWGQGNTSLPAGTQDHGPLGIDSSGIKVDSIGNDNMD